MTEPARSDDDMPASRTRGTIQAEFDWSDVRPSTAVVEMVATAANREPTALEPLYETVDPDALDTLVRSMGANSIDGDATVTFPFEGYQVVVRRDGRVVVRPDEARGESE